MIGDFPDTPDFEDVVAQRAFTMLTRTARSFGAGNLWFVIGQVQR
jgi:hypothetical protein